MIPIEIRISLSLLLAPLAASAGTTITRKYDIEVSPDLFTAFAHAFTNIFPDSGATTFERFNDASATKKFYKVRAAVPLSP